MIRQILTKAAPSARLAYPISTTTLKSQAAKQPIWHLIVLLHTYQSHSLELSQANKYITQNSTPKPPFTTRLFTTTPALSLTASAAQNASPFRLSSDKHESAPTADDGYYSAYKPKRQWPPDMSKLSSKHQFRLERKYRRRAALKYARPKFIKAVTLAQWAIIGCELFLQRGFEEGY